MLANGTRLGFRPHGSEEEYQDLPDLKTIPDIGGAVEMVENTPIAATSKRHEVGVGDPGAMEYTFVHEKNSKGSVYRTVRPYSERHEKLDFQEIWTDGTKFQYTAIPAVSFVRSGGINNIVDLKVTMALCSDINVVDPDEEV